MSSPLAVLMKKESFFIFERNSLSTMFSVEGSTGTCRLIISQVEISSSLSR